MTDNSTITPEEINWAMIIHISAIGGFLIPLGNMILPLIMWLSKRGKSEFIDAHGREVMNFQTNLSAILLAILLIFLYLSDFDKATMIDSILTNRGVLFLSYAIFAILFMIAITRAASSTSKSESYRYPLVFFRPFAS